MKLKNENTIAAISIPRADQIKGRVEDLQRRETTHENLMNSVCCLNSKYNPVYTVLKPPEDPSSPLRQCSKNSTLRRERERPCRHRSGTQRGWWTGDKQPRTTLQTLAGKSISQRQYPQQLHQTTRTHFSHVQVPAQSQNRCNTLQKLLVLLPSLATCKMGISMYLLRKWVGSYEALHIFSSWTIDIITTIP